MGRQPASNEFARWRGRPCVSESKKRWNMQSVHNMRRPLGVFLEHVDIVDRIVHIEVGQQVHQLLEQPWLRSHLWTPSINRWSVQNRLRQWTCYWFPLLRATHLPDDDRAALRCSR